MSFLVLADPSDETAVRVASLLRRRHGAAQVELRTGDELVFANWDHRVSSAGVVSKIRLLDGILLSPGAVIFNRLTTVDVPTFAAASQSNKEYARTEMFALLLSWLASPERHVVNRPSPSGLSGSVCRPFVWQYLANRAGLHSVGVVGTSSTRRFPPPAGAERRVDIDGVSDPYGHPHADTFAWYSEQLRGQRISVLVVGERVIGDVPKAVARSCRRMATLAHLDLLGIHLGRPHGSSTSLSFIGADPCPTVRDPEAVLSIVEFLESLSSKRDAPR